MGDEKKEPPFGFVRRRSPEGTIDRSKRIDRFWKNKANGERVEAVRYLRVVGVISEMRVVFVTEGMPGRELSMPEKEFRETHECIGNIGSGVA